MKNKNFAFTLIRAVALWLFLDIALGHILNLVIISINEIKSLSEFSTPVFNYFYSIVMAGIYLLISALLWSGAEGLSDRFIMTKEKENKIEKVELEKIYPVAITVLGFYFIFSSIPEIVNKLLLSLFSYPLSDDYMSRDQILLIRHFATLFIGLICVMKTGWLIGLFNKLRKLGVEKN